MINYYILTENIRIYFEIPDKLTVCCSLYNTYTTSGDFSADLARKNMPNDPANVTHPNKGQI